MYKFPKAILFAAAGDLVLSGPVEEVVDKGVVIDGLSEDYFGASRPQGAGVDIGANEYLE